MTEAPELNALPPYRYCPVSNKVCGRDHTGNETPVCDVRGWGYLTGRGGGLALDNAVAVEVQRRTGMALAEGLNSRADLPAPPLSDPRVVALVEALRTLCDFIEDDILIDLPNDSREILAAYDAALKSAKGGDR